MTFLRFEDILAWQESRELIKELYTIFSSVKDYDFKSQLFRASISIMNNIAEGFDRSRFANDNKVFVNFLNISYGSCGETKSMIYLAEELGYIDPETSLDIRNKCMAISNKLLALTSYLKNTERPQQSIN